MEYVQSLDRGLAVIRCFSERTPRLTIADVARQTPVHDAAGRVVAAVNATAHASRVSCERLREEFLPRLIETAKRIDADLAIRR